MFCDSDAGGMLQNERYGSFKSPLFSENLHVGKARFVAEIPGGSFGGASVSDAYNQRGPAFPRKLPVGLAWQGRTVRVRMIKAENFPSRSSLLRQQITNDFRRDRETPFRAVAIYINKRTRLPYNQNLRFHLAKQNAAALQRIFPARPASEFPLPAPPSRKSYSSSITFL